MTKRKFTLWLYIQHGRMAWRQGSGITAEDMNDERNELVESMELAIATADIVYDMVPKGDAK